MTQPAAPREHPLKGRVPSSVVTVALPIRVGILGFITYYLFRVYVHAMTCGEVRGQLVGLGSLLLCVFGIQLTSSGLAASAFSR